MSTAAPQATGLVMLRMGHLLRGAIGNFFPEEQGPLAPFVRGPLSKSMQGLPSAIRSCLVAPPWSDGPSEPLLSPEHFATLLEIQRCQEGLATKGFGKQALDDDLLAKAVEIHQKLTKSTAIEIIAAAVRAHGTPAVLAKIWPGAAADAATMDALLQSLILHRSADGKMVSALLANIVLFDGMFQLPAKRASIPKSCPGSGVVVLIETLYTWGDEPIGPTNGGGSRADTHTQLCNWILKSNGYQTQPVPSGEFEFRAALQTAQAGGPPMCELGLVATLVHAGSGSADGIPLDGIMHLADNALGISGKNGEVPKVSMAMKNFNMVLLFYLLFTSDVLVPPPKCSDAWAAMIVEIRAAAGPRQKSHSHWMVRKYVRWFCLCGTRVSIDIAALAVHAAPFIGEISRLVTDPLRQVPLVQVAAAAATWPDTVAACLRPGGHWPHGAPNATAIAVMEHLEPGSVSKAVWVMAIGRYTDAVIKEIMTGAGRTIWDTLLNTLAATGLSFQSAIWISSHDTSQAKHPLQAPADETFGAGCRGANTQALLMIVPGSDTSGVLHQLFIAPGSRVAVMATCAQVPGLLATGVLINLADVGTESGSMLALTTTGAVWPAVTDGIVLATLLSAMDVEVRGESRCIRAIDVSSVYVGPAASRENRRRFGCVVADIPLCPQRAEFECGRHERTAAPRQRGAAITRRSCPRYVLHAASLSFHVVSEENVTSFLVVPIPIVRDGRALILPVYLAFPKGSSEYYNRFVHAPLDVAELAAEMDGRAGAEGKEWLASKLRDMFLEPSVHPPGCPPGAAGAIEVSLLGTNCPYASKIAAALGKWKRSLVTDLRNAQTLPTMIYQFAVLSGIAGGLREMVDRGLALMGSIMHRLFGMPVYNSNEVCGHSDDTELWTAYWINKVCIKKQTQLALEAARFTLTNSVIQKMREQQEQLKGLLGPGDMEPGALEFDFCDASAVALGRVAAVLGSEPAPPAPPAPPTRRLTWRSNAPPPAKRARTDP